METLPNLEDSNNNTSQKNCPACDREVDYDVKICPYCHNHIKSIQAINTVFRFLFKLFKYDELIASLLLIAWGSFLIFAAIVGVWGISLGGIWGGIIFLVAGFYLYFHSLEKLFPPSQEILHKVRAPRALQTVLLKWYVLSPVKKAFVTVILMVGIPVLLFIVISGIDILILFLGMIIEFVVAVI